MPELLGEYRRRYPGIALTLRVIMSEQQLAELESGVLDVGLLSAPIERPTLEHHLATSA